MPIPKSKPKPKPKSKAPLPTNTKVNTEKPPAFPKSNAVKRPKRVLQRDPIFDRCGMAMSRAESVLVSTAGDVIVCRCRRSSTPYISKTENALDNTWSNLIPCCDGIVEVPWSPVFENQPQISGSMSQASEVSTYEWEKISRQHLITASGLKGGAMPMPMPSPKTSDDVKETTPQKETSPEKNHSNRITQEEPEAEADADADARTTILPLPSFDYSHIHEGHNDMVPRPEDNIVGPPVRRKSRPSFPATILESPEEKKEEDNKENNPQTFYHGVPVFLSTLSQVRITKASANPLGAHVLLISAEALLFTYGLNNHGQLGIGIKSTLKDGNRGFHTTPTLITPLLENGGKAINCAAGIDHSLVIVATEGRRVQKRYTNPNAVYADNGALALSRVTSSPCRISTNRHDDNDNNNNNEEDRLGGNSNESVQHHQVYGFGSNDFMKIGLVNAKQIEQDGEEAEDPEDILLPHRVALHCTVWPQKGSSSNYPSQGIFDIAASAEHSAALVRRATGDIEVYTWGNATLGALGLPGLRDPNVKIQGSLTRKPKVNAKNIFPLPTVLESLSYKHGDESAFPTELALGPYCTFVVMSDGPCYSFGFSAEGMLGQGFGTVHTMEPKKVFLPPSEKGCGDGIVSVSAGAFHAIAVTESGQAYSWGFNSDDRLGLGTDEFVKMTNNASDQKGDIQVVEWVPQYVEIQGHVSQSCQATEDSYRVVRACAGYDASLLLMRSGQVLTFGKRSGRLGKGEVSTNVEVPKPMFGGLRLFHNSKMNARQRLPTDRKEATI